MRFKIAVFLLAALGLAGCAGINVNATRGSGILKTETRDVSGFTGVTLAGFGDLTITQGDTEGLTITAEDNLLPLLQTTVQNGMLTIALTTPNISIFPTRDVKFDLKVKNLSSFQLSGAGNVTTSALTADTLTVGTSGAGAIKLAGLNTKTLTVSITGAGSTNVAGTSDTLTATLNGLGSLTAGDLKANTVSVTINGAGSATVWAAQNLTAGIGGAGSVNYYGSPQVKQNISGVGSVKSLGNK